MCQDRTATHAMNEAVKAMTRLPFSLVNVSVEPMMGPRDQLVQSPTNTFGSIPPDAMGNRSVLEIAGVVCWALEKYERSDMGNL